MKWLAIGLLVVLETFGHAAAATGFEATIHWARRVEMSTPVSGVVKTVAVIRGSFVRKGGLMLALDPTPFESALKLALAEKARTTVTRDEAKRDDDQAKQLYADTVLSTVELQNADNRYRRVLADWKAADAKVSLARYRLTYSVIRAPFDGWVLQRNAEPGQTVSSRLAPPTLLVFAAAGRYVARALVPESQLGRFSIGKKVEVKVAGVDYTGTVRSIGMEKVSSEKEISYPVDVVFNVSRPLLRAGQKAEIDLP